MAPTTANITHSSACTAGTHSTREQTRQAGRRNNATTNLNCSSSGDERLSPLFVGMSGDWSHTRSSSPRSLTGDLSPKFLKGRPWLEQPCVPSSAECACGKPTTATACSKNLQRSRSSDVRGSGESSLSQSLYSTGSSFASRLSDITNSNDAASRIRTLSTDLPDDSCFVGTSNLSLRLSEDPDPMMFDMEF